MNTPPLLQAQALSHQYPLAGGRLAALEGVSLALQPQTFTCLVGPSGCGKSTLLRLLAGLLPPQAGEVKLGGEALRGPDRRIGLAFQEPNLLPWRTVEKNLALPLELAGRPRADQNRAVAAMLALLGLSEFRRAYPPALSGGMAQRLSIGRALIAQPEVLLLDEPFGALDALTREQMSEELLRIWEHQQITVLMITHSIQEAVLLADRVLVMSPRPGRVLAEIPIPLARPRHLALLSQADFVALAAQVRAALARQ